jgi:hypothetical protein
MASPLGNVEVALEFGGDFILTPQGDLQVVNDRDDGGLATQQRIERLIMTCPTLKDANGNRIARADDIFNPNYGAGVRRVVGSLVTPDLINRIISQIAAGLAADPGISQDQPPSISVTDGGGGILYVGPVSVTTVIGQVVTVPSRPLNVFGSNG